MECNVVVYLVWIIYIYCIQLTHAVHGFIRLEDGAWKLLSVLLGGGTVQCCTVYTCPLPRPPFPYAYPAYIDT